MAREFELLEFFVRAPAGEPDAVLGSIAALAASESCKVEDCSVSSTCNAFAKPERYQRRARLGECSTCADEASIVRMYDDILGEGNHDQPLDPEIVDVDPVSPGSFIRKSAIDGMNAFWAVVDYVSEPAEVFDVSGRRRIAEAIRENYGHILPD